MEPTDPPAPPPRRRATRRRGAPMITSSAVASPATFDPWASDFLRDPCAGMQRLLHEAPVFHHEPSNAYYVLPYAEVRGILADWETYSNVKTKSMPVRDDL